ncbi:MAG: YbaB/EbfC family nucleoid-associated protein [Acidimicrobiales bacterium]
MSSPFTDNLVEKISDIERQLDGEAWPRTATSVVGTSQGDAVLVHLSDDGASTTVEIDPAVVDPDGVAQLEQFVADAVQDASRRLEALRAERIGAAIRAMIDDLFVLAGNKER